MANYVKSTNFTSKDTLPSGDPLKIVKGTELDVEFNNIVDAIASKSDAANPTFTGTPFAPTAAPGTSTNQIATTAFVSVAISSAQSNAAITGGTITGITDLAIADGGTGASTAAAARTNLGTNDAANLTAGTVATARLGSGTANNTTFLRGDQTWQPIEVLGAAQTWQNVTASRVLGNTYTNSTGRPIQVMVSMRCSGASPAYAYVDGVEIARSFAPDCCGVPQYPTVPFSFIVPNGSTYRCTAFGLSTWAELR